MKDEYLNVLSETPLFKDISKDQLRSLLLCLKPNMRSYNKSDIIAMQGDQFLGVGIVLEGKVSVYKENITGDRFMMNLLEPGEMFGEIVVFSDEHNWPASVQAYEVCKVFYLSKDKFISECSSVCSWHRTLIKNMLEVVSQRAMMLNKKVHYLTIKSMRGKLSTYFMEQYKRAGNLTFTIPMNRNELADFLNVSRPSMSREMGAMRDEGIIDYYMSTIKILNLNALSSAIE